jgi:glycosyltransferase involved in cell wall biosynthesis
MQPGGKQPLRVLMVNTHATAGGAARMALTLVRALNALGHGADLCHCGDSVKDPPLHGMRRLGSRQMNAVLARCGGSLAVQDLGVANEIARKAQTADVIHLHNLHGYYLDWDRLLRAVGDRHLIWTWHDMWAVTGRCASSLGCEGWRGGCDPCPSLEFYPAAWFDHAAAEYRRKSEWLARLPRLLIATSSQWLKEVAIERGIDAERLVYVPNPVDVSDFQPTAMALARKHFRLQLDERLLLFVAADCNNPQKGYRDFLCVLQQTGWRGLVAGGVPRDLPPNVEYLGSFSDARELSLCYSAADALIVPSSFDNSPNTVIESMACGTPVFAYATGGIPAQMHPDWGGAVPVSDVKALSDLLRDQLEACGKKDEAVTSVREYAVQRWGSENIANQYIELYRRVLALD